jgi:hypothetical protein
MNSQSRIVNPLDTSEWDAIVANTPQTIFFHTTSWARVLRDTYGFPLHYFAEIEADRLHALAPLMETGDFRGPRGVGLPFTDYADPFARDGAAAKQLFDSMVSFGKTQRWRRIDLRGCDLFEAETKSSFCYGHTVKLGTLQEMESKMAGPMLRSIKKARRLGVEVDFGASMDRMTTFYRLNCLTRKRHGLPPQPLQWFRNIQRHILAAGQGTIGLARYKSKWIAGGVFFTFKKGAIYKYGASDLSHQEVRPNNLLMWEAMREFAEKKFDSLCLGKTEPFHAGLLQFKESLGGVRKVIREYRYDLKHDQFTAMSLPVRGLHTKVFSVMPLFLLRAFGTLAYKYMG